MENVPAGVVTFLFTDVEGSTRLWEEAPDAMMEALRLHDQLIGDVVASHDGILVKPRGEGDSQFVVFPLATDAVAAAADVRRRLSATRWPTPRPVRVRAALHTGQAELELGDYYGGAVNRAARLRAIAHGGQTLLSGSTFELVRDHLPGGVSVTDLGVHRLKDLARPESVFQLDVDGLDNRFPTLRSLDAIPNNLPVQVTDFVGRETEVARALGALNDTRLLTILAPGGAGKTRLAIQIAAELTTRFPDGVYFIDLAPIGSPDDLIQTASEAIGISLSTDEDPRAQFLSYLAGKHQLLLFDNFEHVLAGAGLLAEILRGAPNVKLMVTSRANLSISGETVFPISGLETTWTNDTEAAKTSGVRLFVDAAKRSDATFVLSEGDLEPLGQILELVGGMPLGIELAAAWTDVLRVSEIAAEIANSLDFLESELGDLPDRHRSIRAVFDYSWAMLGEADRDTFSALSIFRGGFSREAAETVAGASIRNLATLVSKSLLTADRESGRYAVHELLRQYAETALQQDSERLHAVLSAHEGLFAELSAQAEDLMYRDQFKVLGILDADLDNVRSAWRRSLAEGHADAAQQFVFPLWFLYEMRSWHHAGAALLGEGAEAFSPDSSDAAEQIAWATSAAAKGWFLSLLGQPEEGVALGKAAVALLKTHTDDAAYASAVQCLMAGLNYLNRWDEVREVGDDGIRVVVGMDSVERLKELEVWVGVAELGMGNIEEAKRIMEDADAVMTVEGGYRSRAWNSLLLAAVASIEGRPYDAIDILKGVVESARKVGYRRCVQVSLQYLGETQLAVGELDAAEATFVDGLSMAIEMGSAVETAGVLTRIARVRTLTEQPTEAVSLLASVLSDPASSRSMIAESVLTSELATELLNELEASLEPEIYAAAYETGRVKPLDVAAKEVLANE